MPEINEKEKKAVLTKPNSRSNALNLLMKKAKKAVNLMIGNVEVYASEDSRGDLLFDPRIMMKINVKFDKDFLPQEKVVKLNVRGSGFFNEIKMNLRVINTIFMVYPPVYAYILDTRKSEWEKKLIAELNAGYGLELKQILFFNEEDIAGMYQQAGIPWVRFPYALKNDELLIIAGGFTNFNFKGIPLCHLEAEVSASTKENGKNDGDKLKIQKKKYSNAYLTKFSEIAGAYFYIGGEWYHNLFIPELFDKESSLFFAVRIADDGKNLKFFSDSKKTGIDIRGTVHSEISENLERVVHEINSLYLENSGVKELTLSAIYTFEPGWEDFHVDYRKIERAKLDGDLRGLKTPKTVKEFSNSVRSTELLDTEENPFLEDPMILLPTPNQEDIPSYILNIGDDKKSIQCFVSKADNEISIVSEDISNKIYTRHLDEKVNYSFKRGNSGYKISNELVNRFNDKELNTYFSWELHSHPHNRFTLHENLYVFGRAPFNDVTGAVRKKLTPHSIILNTGTEDFWRVGASREHALLLKYPSGQCRIFNVSSNFLVYIVRKADYSKQVISPFRLEPHNRNNQGKNAHEVVRDFIAGESGRTGKTTPGSKDQVFLDWKVLDDLSNALMECTDSLELENEDLIIIGNRVYKFGIPLVMESGLSERARMSVLKRSWETTGDGGLE